jgi:CheY-like chemotaxis protein
MSRVLSGSPVPRHQVFVLGDGNPVVQWSESRVQDIYSGRVLEYDYSLFGHPISDFELEQLKSLGLVEQFNRQYVWVYALPEQGRFIGLRTIEGKSAQSRSYYLNTTLPESDLDEVVALLEERGASEMFTITAYEGIVAVLGYDWSTYATIDEAEAARQALVEISLLFESTAVAFVEVPTMQSAAEEGSLDLDALIASQSANPVTEDKRAVIVCRDDAERWKVESVLSGLHMNVQALGNGSEALQFLEECVATEYLPDMLVMDVHLDDMHGWEMLSRVRELHPLDSLPVIALADDASDEDSMMALNVAGVQLYLARPLNMALLRQSVYETLQGA